LENPYAEFDIARAGKVLKIEWR